MVEILSNTTKFKKKLQISLNVIRAINTQNVYPLWVSYQEEWADKFNFHPRSNVDRSITLWEIKRDMGKIFYIL